MGRALRSGSKAGGYAGRAASRAVLLGLFALVLAGCSEAPPAGETGAGGVGARPVVAVSVLPLKYLVDRLAGEWVRVVVMIPPGASPVSHEPTLAELKALGEASLYVKVGHPAFPFERAWLDRLLADAPNAVLVDASAGLVDRSGDPHLWVAPERMRQLAVRVEPRLRELLPEHADALAANLAQLLAEIDALDAEIRDALAGSPRRRFLVLHPAWGHFAAAYGLEQVAIEEEGKEPDAHELAGLIEQARREGTKVVFVQPQMDGSSAQLVARELGARVESIDPLAYDWDMNLRRVSRLLAKALAESGPRKRGTPAGGEGPGASAVDTGVDRLSARDTHPRAGRPV